MCFKSLAEDAPMLDFLDISRAVARCLAQQVQRHLACESFLTPKTLFP